MGETTFQIGLPKGLFLDEQGGSVQQLDVAPTDVLAVLVGLAAATLDIASGHQNYTFNNLIACLICCDILQVVSTSICQSLLPCSWLLDKSVRAVWRLLCSEPAFLGCTDVSH